MIELCLDAAVDAGAIAEIEKQCFSHPWSADSVVSSAENGTVFFLAKDAGKVAGYAGLSVVLDEGYVTNIAVLPKYRRQGLGRELVEFMLTFAKEKELLFVTLEVRKSNVPALMLYRDLGFTEVGCRKNFYSDPTEDALLMTYFLRDENNEYIGN